MTTATPSPAGEPILSVNGLKVWFPIYTGRLFGRPLQLRAVDDISFVLHAGETLGIVGESGCGKSTLARGVLQLLTPTAGEVVWKGHHLEGLQAKEMTKFRRDLQIIFQDPLASLDPRMTVGDIIGEPLTIHAPELSKQQRRKQVEEIMDQIGLLPIMINRYPHEFSGGQCQRIGIARAMILKPGLIVCDEPVSALDVSIQAQIINLILRLQQDSGVSLLFISHDLSIVRHISHRIMVLYLGNLMETAPRDVLYKTPRHPYTKALISAVPIPNPQLEKNKLRIVLEGDLPSPLAPPSGCVFRTRCPIARPLCGEKKPQLANVSGDHQVACHFWEEQ